MSDYVNSIETITVDSQTKYGVKVNGKNYNYGKRYEGPALSVGGTYEVNVATSPNGAKYINTTKPIVAASKTTIPVGQLQGSATISASPSRPVPAVELPRPVNGSALSPSDKDTRILVQGVLQAVVQSPTLNVQENETVEDAVERTTKRYVEFIRNFGK